MLAISGIVLITLSLIARELPTRHRVLNGVAGGVFLGYAGYLTFGFHGGTYRMFWAAFILPVTMLVNFVRTIDLSEVEGSPQRVRRMPPPEPQPQRTQATRARRAARREAELAAMRAKHAGHPE
ncbi:hypothetical protein [Nocardia sp. R7R-8]|uniref:hypothetical protein n=1 Tax=Nocardia sp. R7R-8 TaxID=3459304 RepID=UPI00403D968B